MNFLTAVKLAGFENAMHFNHLSNMIVLSEFGYQIGSGLVDKEAALKIIGRTSNCTSRILYSSFCCNLCLYSAFGIAACVLSDVINYHKSRSNDERKCYSEAARIHGLFALAMVATSTVFFFLLKRTPDYDFVVNNSKQFIARCGLTNTKLLNLYS